jgi:hypothetical protein
MKKIAADRNYRLMKNAQHEWEADWNPDTSKEVYIYKPMVVWGEKWESGLAPLRVGHAYIFGTESMPDPNKPPQEMMGKLAFKGYDNPPWIRGVITSLTGGGWGEVPAGGGKTKPGAVWPDEVTIAPDWKWSLNNGGGPWK